MKIAIALDGEVLVQQQSLQMQGQKEVVARIAGRLGALARAGHRLLVTHGNGPQVGSMLFRSEVASHAIHDLPLDVCGADTQGATGYLLQQALQNWFLSRATSIDVVSVVTQVVVEPGAAGAAPERKGIGPFFDLIRAQAYEKRRQWEFALVPGYGYQRAVPALQPVAVVEERIIGALFEQGVLVICAGGGGVPVCIDDEGRYMGMEAVVDKSRTTVLLAEAIDADMVVFVSHQDRIEQAFQQALRPEAAPLSLDEVRRRAAGPMNSDESMARKITACRRFLETDRQRTVLFTAPEYLHTIAVSPVAISVQSQPAEMMQQA